MRRAQWVCLLVCVATLAAVAPPPRVHGAPPRKGGVALPRGWDDGIIDRVKEGKSAKLVLAVLDFEGGERLAGKVELKLSDMLTTALVKSARFEVVERNKIDRVIKEQNLQMSGLVDESQAVEMGKMLGAEYVVFGSITSLNQTKIDKFAYDVLRTEIGVDIRVVNVTTGKILLSESAAGVSESKLVTTAGGELVSGSLADNAGWAQAARNAVDQVGGKVADLAVLVGFVLDVSGSTIMFDVGEEQGVKSGYRFVVFRVVSEITHPATGKRVGWKKEMLRLVEVSTTEKSMASGETIETASDAEVKPGDFVILQATREE